MMDKVKADLATAVKYCVESLMVVLQDNAKRDGVSEEAAESLDWAPWSHPANSIRHARAALAAFEAEKEAAPALLEALERAWDEFGSEGTEETGQIIQSALARARSHQP